MAITASRYDLATAWRALRRLLRDPEATDQVFIITRALTGSSLVRSFNRFAETRTGRAVLAERRELLPTLADRDALRRLPAGSLGRAYLAFVEREQLSADGLVDASEANASIDELPERLALFARRFRDQHDLWHVVTGYGRDVLGEDCLLGFTYAQGRNPGVAFIALAGAGKLSREHGLRAWQALWRGYRDGCQAGWLPAEDWELRLSQPLAQVRRELRINTPSFYRTLSSAPSPVPA